MEFTETGPMECNARSNCVGNHASSKERESGEKYKRAEFIEAGEYGRREFASTAVAYIPAIQCDIPAAGLSSLISTQFA